MCSRDAATYFFAQKKLRSIKMKPFQRDRCVLFLSRDRSSNRFAPGGCRTVPHSPTQQIVIHFAAICADVFLRTSLRTETLVFLHDSNITPGGKKVPLLEKNISSQEFNHSPHKKGFLRPNVIVRRKEKIWGQISACVDYIIEKYKIHPLNECHLRAHRRSSLIVAFVLTAEKSAELWIYTWDLSDFRGEESSASRLLGVNTYSLGLERLLPLKNAALTCF